MHATVKTAEAAMMGVMLLPPPVGLASSGYTHCPPR